jgi:uncharacterized BrkB/YihY/UPF0761 family membrane protein
MNESKSATKDPICGMTVDEATALHAETRWKGVLLFAATWTAALCATALLQTTESIFIGSLCAIVALLTWIYLSGCIFIFGACLCAAQAEGRSLQAETITTH